MSFFLDNNYDASNVIRKRDKIEEDLEALGIEIVEMPEYGEIVSGGHFDKRYLDLEELKLHLTKALKYSIKRDDAVEHDVMAIDAISRLREGKSCRTIEGCRAILITTNYGLICTVLNLYKNSVLNGNINFLIGDIEITSLLWLKSADMDSTLPKMKLLEAAYAACEPTTELLDAFENVIQTLHNEERLSEKDALILRTQSVQNRDLVAMTGNDSDEITEDLIFKIKQKYDENIFAEKTQEIKALQKQLERSKETVIRDAEKKADKAQKRIRGLFKGISVCFTIIFIAIIIQLCIEGEDGRSHFFEKGALIVLAMYNGFSAFDIITGRLRGLNRLVEKLATRRWHKVYENEMLHYEKLFKQQDK